MGGLKNLPNNKNYVQNKNDEYNLFNFFPHNFKKKVKNKEIPELLQFFHISKLISGKSSG
jgi:hypothetical protein